jgi:hypothetical protein
MSDIQKDIDFCFRLIGSPWESGASGPGTFDCWGLLRYVLGELRHVEIPAYPDVWDAGLKAVCQKAESEISANWRALDRPIHLCGVAMGRGRRTEHVGLWLGLRDSGGILHCSEAGGVTFQSPASIRSTGIQHFRYYQFRP